jgi:hypothetical protein
MKAAALDSRCGIAISCSSIPEFLDFDVLEKLLYDLLRRLALLSQHIGIPLA